MLPLPLRLLGALTAVMLACPAVICSAAPEQSVSTSRQFIVYGAEIRLRGAICGLAERTKRDLLELLEQQDAWATPIVIHAQYPQANLPELPRIALNLSQTGTGLKLQLDLIIDAEISHPEVRRELLRALLLEMIYRGEPAIPAGASYVSPPDWLLDGFQGEHSEMTLDRVSTLLNLSVAGRSAMRLEKLLQQKPELLDAPGRQLYRAHAIALVDFLRRAPKGPARLGRFIVEMRSASNDPMAELRKYFPELFPADHATETIWDRQVARLATRPPYQLLTAAETAVRLDEVLRLRFSDPGTEKSFDLAEFPKFLKHPSARLVLGRLSHELGQLEIRANPIYRPIISEFAKVSALLLRGKTNGLATRLERLRVSRQAVARQMSGIDDYLNWFQATRLRSPSGVFADYLKAAEAASRPAQRKRDPISIYLDALQNHFED